LKGVLSALGLPTDTSPLEFPHARFSLSHSGDWAAAAGADKDCAGIGIDLEIYRKARERMADFFLTERELKWFATRPQENRSDDLLRLWTVKEAAFKADWQNENATLREYELQDPSAIQGVAARATKSGVAIFTYSSRHPIEIDALGWFSLATALKGDSDAF
jgi:phosphopantetheinyl transferase